MTTDVITQVEPEARPYLDGPLGPMIAKLEEIAREVAAGEQVSIVGIEIKFKPLLKQRRTAYIKFVVYTGEGINPEQAFAYWDAIGQAVDGWLPDLEPKLRQLFDKTVYYTVEWIEPGVN